MDLVELVASSIERRIGAPGSRTLVAVDGPDAAGKTTLADAGVVAALKEQYEEKEG